MERGNTMVEAKNRKRGVVTFIERTWKYLQGQEQRETRISNLTTQRGKKRVGGGLVDAVLKIISREIAFVFERILLSNRIKLAWVGLSSQNGLLLRTRFRTYDHIFHFNVICPKSKVQIRRRRLAIVTISLADSYPITVAIAH